MKSASSRNQLAFRRALIARPDGWNFVNAASSDDLFDAVASLPDSDYMQVTLRYLDGLSLTELTEEYGIKRRHVESLLILAANAIAGSLDTSQSEGEVPMPDTTSVTAIIQSHRLRAQPQVSSAASLSGSRPQSDVTQIIEPEYTSENFMRVAQCRSNPDLFFSSTKAGIEAAKKMCGRCAVKAICLQAGLDLDKKLTDDERRVSGIWGGLTPGERKKLSKRT